MRRTILVLLALAACVPPEAPPPAAVVDAGSPEACASSATSIGEALPDEDAARFYAALSAPGLVSLTVTELEEVEAAARGDARLARPLMERYFFPGCQRYTGMTAAEVLAAAE